MDAIAAMVQITPGSNGLMPQADAAVLLNQVKPDPVAVAQFQHFMGLPPTTVPEVAVAPPTNVYLDRAAESMRQKAKDFIQDLSAKRDEIEKQNQELLPNLDFNNPSTQIVMLNHSIKVMQSTTQLHLLSSFGGSIEKNTKMLFQNQG